MVGQGTMCGRSGTSYTEMKLGCRENFTPINPLF